MPPPSLSSIGADSLLHRHAAFRCLAVLGVVFGSFIHATCVAQNFAGNVVDSAEWHWVSTWAVSPQTQDALGGGPAPAAGSFNAQTLRQIIHTSIGGSQVRVRFSNQFGTDPLVIGTAGIALSAGNAQMVPGSHQALTFGGQPSLNLAPGALAVSDPVNFEVPALSDLAISLYLPNLTLNKTLHSTASQVNYVAEGDQTATDDPATSSATGVYSFLKNVEISAPLGVGAIVCLGDSITDGFNSTPGANHRWPNFLAQRFQARSGLVDKPGVIDQGISGNRLCHNATGPAILSRFDSDVVAQVGVTHVILLAGINDIALGAAVPAEAVSADDIVAAYRQIIARAHEAGLKIYGGTLTPYAGTISYYSDDGETEREAVNQYIRTSGEFDGVIDFEAALRDASTPPHLLPQYDSGDHLHPNDAGYAAMAAAVKLKYLKSVN